MLRVLVVEDDPAFQESYRDLLENLGYTAVVVGDVARAREVLRDEAFDAAILDQRLQSGTTSADGMDLIEAARSRGAKVFLVTGYATDEMVKKAYERGVYDFVEKGPRLRTLVSAKLDQVRELARANSRALPAEADARIRDLWSRLDEGTADARGRRLEDLMLLILTSVPGFREEPSRLRSAAEEIDLTIRNESSDPFWSKLSPYIVAECKNWSKPVGGAEVGWFADKLRDRPDARLGFLFAPSGITGPVDVKIDGYRRDGIQIVPVDRGGIERLVNASDRNEELKALHRRWAVGRSPA